MRTLTDATMFVVKGPHGPYYALQDNDSGVVVTERTEQAAAALANEKDMLIVDRREITHAELLKMTGMRSAEHAGV
jgi:hypothetical protein